MTNHAESLATYDAIVIGAGAGGMAAAARLNASGFTTLLVERYDRVGGRASTVDVDGFRVNTGALIIELGGENAKLFEDLGLTINARTPKRPLVLRLGRWDVPMMSGLTGLIFRALLALVGAVARRAPRMRPQRGISTAQWLSRMRAGAFVHGLVRNLTSAMFAAEPSDVEAAVFFDYLTKPKALDTYAMHPEGSIGPWRQLADHFEHSGGTLWLNSQAVALTFDDSGRVDGATIRRPDGTVHVSARVVVSNAGPVATVRMCGDANLPGGYGEHVRAQSNPSP